MLCAGFIAAPGEGAPPPVAKPTLRIGFTYSMFVGVNENDATASIRALSAVVSRESEIPADPTPQLFVGADAVVAAVAAGKVDAVGLTTEEFAAIKSEAGFDRFLMSVRENNPTETYLVLVHQESPAQSLADLRGKRLAIFTSPRMCLALPWLEVQLARQNLPAAAEIFGAIVDQPKLSKAVLDVFFKKNDACLVTRSGFSTMVELNPQLGTQLRAIAESVAMVPALFAVRTDFSEASKDRIVRVFAGVHRTPAGQQALTIFQVGQVAERPLSMLDSALSLLAQYAELRPEASAARVNRLRRVSANPSPRP